MPQACIFGRHDERTLAQMGRCMQVGSVAGGVQDLKAQARNQLGTVGSGNHYVDLFEDEEGFVWIGVHFGSRGLGHKSATKYLKQAGGRDGMDVEPALVRTDSELGERYLAAM